MVKVGICGLGERAATVAAHFHAASDSVEVVGYVDPNPYGLRNLNELGICPVGYDDLAIMLKQEGVDLLIVGSPNHLHLEHIEQALKSSDAVIFTEKPAVATQRQTFELLGLLQKYGAERVLVGLVLRYSQLYRDLENVHSSGYLGEVISIDAREHIAPHHGAFFMRDWRRYERYSGGFMLEKCCHDLDMYMSLIPSRPKHVVSFGGRRFFVEQNARRESSEIYNRWQGRWNHADHCFTNDGDLIDHQTVLVEFANGANLAFHTNLNAPSVTRQFCVLGTDGMVEGDFERAYFRARKNSRSKLAKDVKYSWKEDDRTHYGSESLMVKEILSHVEHGNPLPVTIKDALAAGLVAMAIDEARKTRSILCMADTWDEFDAFDAD